MTPFEILVVINIVATFALWVSVKELENKVDPKS
jgi:hypothetical protein